MTLKQLKEHIDRLVSEIITESGYYDDSMSPIYSRSKINKGLGVNPLYADKGNHANADNLSQPSTVDWNGENLKNAEKVVLSDNKFMIYKVKNFANPDIKATQSLFGDDRVGDKRFRDAIDTIYGSAKRNGKNVQFRVITCENTRSKSSKFYEFSYDNDTWYIVKPNPTTEMKESKLVKKQ